MGVGAACMILNFDSDVFLPAKILTPPPEKKTSTGLGRLGLN